MKFWCRKYLEILNDASSISDNDKNALEECSQPEKNDTIAEPLQPEKTVL